MNANECDARDARVHARSARRSTAVARAFMANEGKVRASHVLVKHAGSRRPASWRDPEGAHIAKKARPERMRDSNARARGCVE
jgi:hypothetical protein